MESAQRKGGSGMILYIVRHGEPIYGPDILTELGHKQAQALVKRFERSGLDRIFSSPMGRARQTAQPTADALGLPVKIEPWMREIWPELAPVMEDGRRAFVIDQPADIFRTPENRDHYNDWYDMPALSKVEGKQVMARVVRHSDDLLRRLGYRRVVDGIYEEERPNDEHVAVFCHAGFGMTWLTHLLGIPPHLLWASFTMTHTGVTVLQFAKNPSGQVTPRCLCLSDMSHLLDSGLPYRYNNSLIL